MPYTINELAKISGVTTRTLRFYEEKGLLSPDRKENDYRLYTKEQVDILQQILFYRELGVSLDEIYVLLNSETYSHVTTLESHYSQLVSKRNQLNTLMKNVEKTIQSIKGEISMTDKEKFEGFKSKMVKENEEKYGKEVRDKYTDEQIDASNAKLMGLTSEQYESVMALEQEIKALLKQAVEEGLDPTGAEGHKLAQVHKEWLCFFWQEYSKEAHKGVSDMYVGDERFAKYYNDIVCGGAEYIRGAIYGYCS